MMSSARRLVYVLLSLALVGCATSRCPNLGPELAYCLQPPATGPRVAFLQHVAVTNGERVETLIVQTENDAERLAVVGISPLGQTLVSATWDGVTVQLQPAMPSAAPDAGAMLAFAQFGLLSFDELGRGFAADVLRTSEARADGETLYVRNTSGRTLLEIRREGRQPLFARSRIQLPTVGLDIQSRTLDSSPSAPAAR